MVMVTKLGRDSLAQVAENAMDEVHLRETLFYHEEVGTGTTSLAVGIGLIKRILQRIGRLTGFFEPNIDSKTRDEMIRGWNKAVKCSFGWALEDWKRNKMSQTQALEIWLESMNSA